MEVTILAFGQLAELTGKQSWKLQDITDITALKQSIETSFPAISNINYLVAIDKKIIKENAPLADQATVALLPPFSGG
jgi:sulfur-carrier protein